MAVTQSDLDVLDAAIASGTLELRFQDRMERFQSTSDMIKARNLIYLQLHPRGVTPPVQRQIRIYTGRGL